LGVDSKKEKNDNWYVLFHTTVWIQYR
jgi:hypothetical protein